MIETSTVPTRQVKFSEDVVPLGDVKVNPGAVVRRTSESGRPVLLTSRGRGVAVLQSLAQYEAAQDELSFLRSVVEGIGNADNGGEVTLAEARARLAQK